MTRVKITELKLPEGFATNVLALRGIANSVRRSNKGGWQSDRCNHKTYPWAADVIEAVKAAAGVEGEITYWFNINSGCDYNEWHNHDKGDADELCACLYIQVPEHAGGFEYRTKTASEIIEPKKGLLLIFSDDLMHRVLPNRGEGERISMAFNLWKMLK
jgi:hypothetical protein